MRPYSVNKLSVEKKDIGDPDDNREAFEDIDGQVDVDASSTGKG